MYTYIHECISQFDKDRGSASAWKEFWVLITCVCNNVCTYTVVHICIYVPRHYISDFES